MPFSVNQVQRGAAADTRPSGTLVASEMILITAGSFAAAASLKMRAACRCTIAKRTASDRSLPSSLAGAAKHASCVPGSMSEPGNAIFPVLFFSARKASGTGMFAASTWLAPSARTRSG